MSATDSRRDIVFGLWPLFEGIIGLIVACMGVVLIGVAVVLALTTNDGPMAYFVIGGVFAGLVCTIAGIFVWIRRHHSFVKLGKSKGSG